MPEPLALAFHPLTPVRTPREGRATVLYGYHLRLANGPMLTSDDPLLAAFAASIDAVEETSRLSEPLQADSFDPGQQVRLVREGVDSDGDEVVGVWDLDELRRAGTLPWETAARVGAAIDHGLEIDALVLSEMRVRSDGRRCAIAVLVHPPALITVDVAAGGPLQRPQARMRPRLVLIVDDAAGLQWWDPSGAAGPMQLDAVPVSPPLAHDLRELASAFRKATSDDDGQVGFMSQMQHQWQRHVLDQRMRTAWERVRRELGRRYAVGLMLKGMSAPAWSPDEFDDPDEDDEIPL